MLDNHVAPAEQKLPAGAYPNNPASYKQYFGKEYSPDIIMEQARRFVRENRNKPFLLYVPTTLPHVALQAPEDSLAEYLGKWPDPPFSGNRGFPPTFAPRASYAAMITRMDRDIGRLMQLVSELGLDGRTIFIFTSDNGPMYHEHGTDSEFFQSAGPLRGLKGSLYEGGIREPLVVRRPGHIAAGTTSDRVTGFEDWMPTLMELAGAPRATPRNIDGISFAPVLRGEQIPERSFLYREIPAYGGQQLARVGDWVGIRQNMAPRGQTATAVLRTELYNLKEDIGQKHDVAAKRPDIVKKIEQLFHQQHTPSKEFPLPGVDKL